MKRLDVLVSPPKYIYSRSDRVHFERAVRNLLQTLGYFGGYLCINYLAEGGMSEVDLLNDGDGAWPALAAESLCSAGLLRKEAEMGLTGVMYRFFPTFERGSGVVA